MKSFVSLLFSLTLFFHGRALAQSQNVPPQTNGRGSIGVNCLPEANGCRIRRIIKSGPAERAGLRIGDLVLRLNSSDPAAAVEQIARNAPGTKITLPFQRGAERKQAAITVEDQLAIALRGAAVGDPVAEETLGAIYRNGVGVPKDAAEAFKWYRKAADQGYDLAQYDIGSMYGKEAVPKDDRAAVEWYRKAADQGLPAAQLAMGVSYSQGLGVPKDMKTAIEWFHKAADQGSVAAQESLGVIYANGMGVPKDEKVGAEWYRKAAEQGDARAEYALGQMYSEGRGVTKDDKAAADWFRKAADQGNELAEYNLGWSYENGRGVPKDLKAALDWYKRAAEHGFEPAKQKLAQMQH